MATNENEIDVIVGDKAECKLMYERKENMFCLLYTSRCV